jgi:hypothetical protein
LMLATSPSVFIQSYQNHREKVLDFTPEYFIITKFGELDKYHADLKEYLISNCSLVGKSRQYLDLDFISFWGKAD